MTRRKSAPRYTKHAVTHEGERFLTEAEYKKLIAPQSRKTYGLVVDGRSVWRRSGKGMNKPTRLDPGERDILLGYMFRRGQMMKPRTAAGSERYVSLNSSKTMFKKARKKVDVPHGRRDWQLFKNGSAEPSEAAEFSFEPPSEFRYLAVKPYSVEAMLDLAVSVGTAKYEISPASGVFVAVEIENIGARPLRIANVQLEIPREPGATTRMHVLTVDSLAADLYGVMPKPPLKLAPGELLSGEWAFDFVDEECLAIPSGVEVNAQLKIIAGSDRQVISRPVKIMRRTDQPEPQAADSRVTMA